MAKTNRPVPQPPATPAPSPMVNAAHAPIAPGAFVGIAADVLYLRLVAPIQVAAVEAADANAGTARVLEMMDAGERIILVNGVDAQHPTWIQAMAKRAEFADRAEAERVVYDVHATWIGDCATRARQYGLKDIGILVRR